MAWDDIRQEARLAVHREFGVPAVYQSPVSGAEPVPCTVRFHTRIARFGDLDREGFAQVVEDINRVIFMRSEVDPLRRGTVTINGRTFVLEVREPSDDGFLAVWNVVPQNPTP